MTWSGPSCASNPKSALSKCSRARLLLSDPKIFAFSNLNEGMRVESNSLDLAALQLSTTRRASKSRAIDRSVRTRANASGRMGSLMVESMLSTRRLTVSWPLAVFNRCDSCTCKSLLKWLEISASLVPEGWGIDVAFWISWQPAMAAYNDYIGQSWSQRCQAVSCTYLRWPCVHEYFPKRLNIILTRLFPNLVERVFPNNSFTKVNDNKPRRSRRERAWQQDIVCFDIFMTNLKTVVKIQQGGQHLLLKVFEFLIRHIIDKVAKTQTFYSLNSNPNPEYNSPCFTPRIVDRWFNFSYIARVRQIGPWNLGKYGG